MRKSSHTANCRVVRFLRWCLLLFLFGVLARSGIVPADAAIVRLRIRAGNPLDKEQSVEIHSNLPEGVTSNHIINAAGLNVGYDVKADRYFVHGNVSLGPKQVTTHDVEIEDIWVLDVEELEALLAHGRQLVTKLTDEPSAEVAAEVLGVIERDIKGVIRRQEDNRIGPGVTPLNHIRAFETNRDVMKQVRTDIGRLENLVLRTGQDAGLLLGDDRRLTKPERFTPDEPETWTRATIQIDVRNTSPDQARRIDVERTLPPEVRIQDVISAEGLDVASDPSRGGTYVYRRGLELEPGQSLTFEVVIRDRWNINEPRMDLMLDQAEHVYRRVKAREKYEGIERSLEEVIDRLKAIKEQKGPTKVDARYVAFYRAQSQSLNAMERRLDRIVMALPQIDRSTRIGTRIKPPSAKTTWMLIYIILGFLALVGVGFFIRWSGRSEAENADRRLSGED